MEPIINNLFYFAEYYPDKIAVKDRDTSYSYWSLVCDVLLTKKRLLRYSDIALYDRVFICLKKGYAYIVTLLSLVYLGKPFVLLDPDLPKQYLAQLLDDTSIIITSQTTSHIFDGITGVELFITYPSESEWIKSGLSDIGSTSTPHNDLVCYIYTSGTTGKPKCVAISNYGLENLLIYQQHYYPIRFNSNILNNAPVSFDVVLSELFGAVYTGSTLFIPPEKVRKNPNKLASYIITNKINIIKLTPEHLNYLPVIKEHFLETIVVGGECATSIKNIGYWINNCRVINEYGSTETCVAATSKILTNQDASNNIGYPIRNTKAYILDDNLDIVNGKGELYLAGAPVSTKDNIDKDSIEPPYYSNPFSNSYKYSILYRTGDFVTKNDKGELLYLGRKDFFKVHGYRVDPVFIKENLLTLSYIKGCFVHSFTPDDELILYITLMSSKEIARKFGHKTYAQNMWSRIFDNYYMHNNAIGLYDNIHKKYLEENETKDWVANLTHLVKQLSNLNILDIGCGNGFLIDFLEDCFSSYVGVDNSEQAIQQCKNKFKDRPKSSINFVKGDVIEYLSKNNTEFFDVIIINSCVQYLANIEQLDELIRKCSCFLNYNGFIFIGDVKNYENIKLYYKVKELGVSSENAHNIKPTNIAFDQELYISPTFFKCYQNDLFSNVILLNKYGKSFNEYTIFRYDVVLSECGSHVTQNEFRWPVNLKLLNTKGLDSFIIRDVPNNKLYCLRNNKPYDKLTDYFLTDLTNYDYLMVINDHPKQDCFDLIAFVEGNSHILPSDLMFGKSSLKLEDMEGIANDPYLNHFYDKIKSEISNLLKRKLPSYMRPLKIIFLNEFPLNKNGKINTNLLPSDNTHVFSDDSETVYSKKDTIKAIWKRVLCVSVISDEDAFFELGGDSIACIQFVSEASKKGLSIRYQDVFDFPVLKDLSTVCFDEPNCDYHHNWPTYPIKSPPIFDWFIRMCKVNPIGFYQIISLDFKKQIPFHLLQTIIRQLINEIPIFKLRFTEDLDKFYIGQHYLEVSKHLFCQDNLSKAQLQAMLETNDLKMSLVNGSLIKFLVDQKSNRGRLFIIAHHSIVDGVSWRLIISRLEELYCQMLVNSHERSSEIRHEPSTFYDWVVSRNQYLFKSELHFKEEVNYWRQLLSNKVDLTNLSDNELPISSSIQYFYFTIPNLSILYSDIHSHFNTQVNDVLLACFRSSLEHCLNIVEFFVEVESHGREDIAPNLNITNSIGWFTSVYPLYFRAINETSKYFLTLIKDTKNKLRNVPSNGLCYTHIRESILNKETKVNTHLGFNYLGNYNNLFQRSNLFEGFSDDFSVKGVPISFLDYFAEGNTYPHNLKLTCWFYKHRLYGYFSYNSKMYSYTFINSVAQTYKSHLTKLLATLRKS